MPGEGSLKGFSEGPQLKVIKCSRENCGTDNWHTNLVCRVCGRPLKEVPNFVFALLLVLCLILPIIITHNASAEVCILLLSIWLLFIYQYYILREAGTIIRTKAIVSMIFAFLLWLLLLSRSPAGNQFSDRTIGGFGFALLLIGLVIHLIFAIKFGDLNSQSFRHKLFNFSFVYTINIILCSFCSHFVPALTRHARDCSVEFFRYILPERIEDYAGVLVHFFDLGFRYRLAAMVGYFVLFVLAHAVRESLRMPVKMTDPWYLVVGSVVRNVFKGAAKAIRPMALTWFIITRRTISLFLPTAVLLAIIILLNEMVGASAVLSREKSHNFGAEVTVLFCSFVLWLLTPLFISVVCRIKRENFLMFYDNQVRGNGRIFASIYLGFFMSGLLLMVGAFVVSGTTASFFWRDSLVLYKNLGAAHMLTLSLLVMLGSIIVRRRIGQPKKDAVIATAKTGPEMGAKATIANGAQIPKPLQEERRSGTKKVAMVVVSVVLILCALYLLVNLFSPTQINLKSARGLAPGSGMEFVLIPAGSFTMGCSDSDPSCDLNALPAHEVRVTRGFEMQLTEVTQRQWQVVMGTNPSNSIEDIDCPVVRISWNDVHQFLEKLNSRGDGYKYRLPTEAEWEYAARGGPNGGYDGNNRSSVAWCKDNAENKAHRVKGKQANGYGLYDMLGNVWELCEDWYEKTYNLHSPSVDSTGPPSGQERSIRGGAYSGNCLEMYPWNRFYVKPDQGYLNVGFRCVRELQ
jgi:formylglycine-generating enzyme required for sulfatase activity